MKNGYLATVAHRYNKKRTWSNVPERRNQTLLIGLIDTRANVDSDKRFLPHQSEQPLPCPI
jgi:hypothetical protein